ncbi:MAG: hypothetical protein NVS9B10_21840 [Nevskia sp.]
MSEFNDRVAAQRAVLVVVNRINWKEPLYSLSSKAITRWLLENRLEPSSTIIQLVTKISEELFFLANKSQEQITDEYQAKAETVRNLTSTLEREMLQTRAT